MPVNHPLFSIAVFSFTLVLFTRTNGQNTSTVSPTSSPANVVAIQEQSVPQSPPTNASLVQLPSEMDNATTASATVGSRAATSSAAPLIVLPGGTVQEVAVDDPAHSFLFHGALNANGATTLGGGAMATTAAAVTAGPLQVQEMKVPTVPTTGASSPVSTTPFAIPQEESTSTQSSANITAENGGGATVGTGPITTAAPQLANPVQTRAVNPPFAKNYAPQPLSLAVQACSSTDCNARGTCFGPKGLPMCLCHQGFTGTRCQEASCDHAQNCNDRGWCVGSRTQFSCFCHLGYGGTQCEFQHGK